jgi:hypothetical protein
MLTRREHADETRDEEQWTEVARKSISSNGKLRRGTTARRRR